MSQYRVSIVLDGQDNASDDIRRVKQEVAGLDQAGRNAGGASGGLGQLRQALGGVIAGFGVAQFAQKVGELNDLGRAATSASNTFTQLSGGAAQAAANLASMRTATRGTVDDMTLMNGANRLLLMNLAGTGEEAAKLTNIAVTLGRAMGQDAAGAVGDFAALLANQSIPRLDNFGISSARVRARIEELQDQFTGMSREAAFTQAVLEEGQLSMDRLGTSIDANSTAWDRVSTHIQNATQDLGQFVAQGLEAGAQLVLMVGMVDDALRVSRMREQGLTVLSADEVALMRDQSRAAAGGVNYEDWTWRRSRNAQIANEARDRTLGSMSSAGRVGGASVAGQISDMRGLREQMSGVVMGGVTGSEEGSIVDLLAQADALMGEMEANPLVSATALSRTKELADEMREMANAAQRGAASLDDILGRGEVQGVGRDALMAIAEQLPEDQRQAFLEGTGAVGTRRQGFEEVSGIIASLPAGERESAARNLAEMVAQPGFDFGSASDLMGRLGYMQSPGGGGAGYTVQPGDSWWGLYGADYASNPNYTGEMLVPGMVLGGGGGWQRVVGGAAPEERYMNTGRNLKPANVSVAPSWAYGGTAVPPLPVDAGPSFGYNLPSTYMAPMATPSVAPYQAYSEYGSTVGKPAGAPMDTMFEKTAQYSSQIDRYMELVAGQTAKTSDSAVSWDYSMSALATTMPDVYSNMSDITGSFVDAESATSNIATQLEQLADGEHVVPILLDVRVDDARVSAALRPLIAQIVGEINTDNGGKTPGTDARAGEGRTRRGGTSAATMGGL